VLANRFNMSLELKNKDSKSFGSNCIIIGNGLITNKDYHLLVDINGVSIDKIMTKEEYETISKLLKAVGVVE
jgi:hypothetical protein